MLLKQVIISVQSHITNANCQTRSFYRSATTLLDDKWRRENRLTKNSNAFGPLTNMQDYSFKDGRPTPFGVRQMIRINKQRDYFTKIKTLSAQIDFAVEKHRKLQEEKIEERQKVIDSKLKPKGILM